MRDKGKKQLIDELAVLQQKVSELEELETMHQQTEEILRISQHFIEIAFKHNKMKPLLKEFVKEVQSYTKCTAVGIRMLDEEGNIPYEAYKGFSKKFYELESPLSVKSDQCMCINVIKGDADPKLPFFTECGSFYMNATTRFLATVSEEEKGKTRNICNEFGYESVALIPICVNDRIFGLIHVSDPKENMVPLEKVEILERIAMQLGTAIDRVRLEEAFINASSQLQLTFDAMNDSISLINLEGRILRCNVAMEKFLGKPANEIIGSFCWELIHGESEPIEGCPIVRMKETHQRENKILQLDDRWLEVIVDPQFDDDKKLIGAVHFISDITERKRIEKELKNSRKELRNLAAHIQSAREEERIIIAQEIHNRIAQSLTALKMDLFLLGEKLPKDQKFLIKKIRSMSKLTDDIIKVARGIYTELRPSLLDDLGLSVAVEWKAEQFQKRTRIKCEVSIDSGIPALDKARSTTIFRIFEEILTNIMRHAKATKVKVSLRKKNGKLELKVKDNGKGITRRQLTDPKSFGLIGIREQTKSLGGEDRISGVPGKGTTVTVRIPLKKTGQEFK